MLFPPIIMFPRIRITVQFNILLGEYGMSEPFLVHNTNETDSLCIIVTVINVVGTCNSVDG